MLETYRTSGKVSSNATVLMKLFVFHLLLALVLATPACAAWSLTKNTRTSRTRLRSTTETSLSSTQVLKQEQAPLMRTWDARYSMGGWAYGTEPNTFLVDCLHKYHLLATTTPGDATSRSSKSCLVLAAGEGRNAVYMAQQRYNVTAVDRSAVGLFKARALAASRHVKIETRQVDLADYDYGRNQQWDLIVVVSCHVSPATRRRLLKHIPNALKPGGTVVLECYTPRQPVEFNTGGPHSQDLLYTAAMLQEAWGERLDLRRNKEVVRTILEGRYHIGKGAVVQCVGQKPVV